MIRVGLARSDPSYRGLQAPWEPGELYPEVEPLLGVAHKAAPPNPVYAAVRAALRGMGLDEARFGTPAWNPLGEKILENFDWAHPAILEFEDPYVLAPGDYIEYQCDYDNGVDREVRRCGDSRYDAGCTPGEPRTVTFGVTAQDETCFLTGFYYTD